MDGDGLPEAGGPLEPKAPDLGKAAGRQGSQQVRLGIETLDDLRPDPRKQPEKRADGGDICCRIDETLKAEMVELDPVALERGMVA